MRDLVAVNAGGDVAESGLGGRLPQGLKVGVVSHIRPNYLGQSLVEADAEEERKE